MTNKQQSVEEIRDWIETALDADAHGKWHRAPNFNIIQDVAELLAPRIITLTEQVRAERSREIAQHLTDTFKDKSEIGVNHLLLELGKLSDDHLK